MAKKILYLPMDESKDSKVAYDYSHSRADGVVENATFGSGIMCNAVSFDGGGSVKIDGTKMNFNLADDNLTYMAYVKIPSLPNEHPNELIFAFQFKDGHYEELKKVVKNNAWYNVAVTKETIVNSVGGKSEYRNNFIIYINGNVFHKFMHNDELTWMGIDQKTKFRYGYGLIDEVKVFDKALTMKEIIEEISMEKNQKYFIDGVNIKEAYGVCISGSDGIINKPKMKKPLSTNNMKEHGRQVYLNKKYYDSRHITLNCFISAANKGEFILKISEFEKIFMKSALQLEAPTNRLMISVIPTKPLIYEVYNEDEIVIDKEWHDLEMVGTFQLKLIEAEPIKRVMKVIVDDPTTPFQMNIQNSEYLNVYWGDGNVTYDVLSKNSITTIEHKYNKVGEYYVLIYGDLESIKTLNSNAILIWKDL